MIDRIFFITLTLAVLVGSTLAIGSEFVAGRSVVAPVNVVAELPRVVVTGHIDRTRTVAQGELESTRIVQ